MSAGGAREPFERWARGGLAAYPAIYAGGSGRVYIRAGEARELLRGAFSAGGQHGTSESAGDAPTGARDRWRPALPHDHGAARMRLSDLPKWLLVMSEPDWRTGCLIWRGRTDSDGYGRAGGQLVHREAWRELAGPIPEGMTLDHVRDRGCRSPACWAPWHLEPVTAQENRRRIGARRGR